MIFNETVSNSTLNNTAIPPGGSPLPGTGATVDNGLPISSYSKGLLYIGYSLIFIIGTVGNSLVIYKTIFKNKKKNGKNGRTSHDYQVVSLAIADFSGSIFIPMNMIHDITNSHKWLLAGDFGCKLVTSMNPLLTVTSAWMMVAIAITRFRTIRRSRNINIGHDCFNKIGIILAWVLGVTIASPYAYYLHIDSDGSCIDDWDSTVHQFVWCVMLVAAWCPLPLVMLSILSLFSYRNLKQMMTFEKKHQTTNHPSSSIIKNKNNSNNNNNNNNDINGSKTSGNINSNSKSHQRQAKIAKTFTLIIFAFFLLTTPYAIFFLVWAYTAHFNKAFYLNNLNEYLAINLLMFFIASLNSIINPFIYARTAIIKCFKRRNNTVSATTEENRTQTMIIRSRKISEWTTNNE